MIFKIWKNFTKPKFFNHNNSNLDFLDSLTELNFSSIQGEGRILN